MDSHTDDPQSMLYGDESSKIILSVDESTLRDSDTISSRSSTSTLTNNARWLPGGRLSGLLLHAFGSSTVDLVVHMMIKKRLDSIFSKMDFHSPDEGRVWTDINSRSTRVAYRDLVELSSNSYSDKIRSRAMFLRLIMLRSIIRTQCSWLNPGDYQQKFCEVWAELDSLQPEVKKLKTFLEMRRTLVEKVADELSSLSTKSWTDAVEKALIGTNFVAILCHDLAHGTGGYAVQNALSCISFSDWGVSQLRRLDQESDVVRDAVERLLVDFDNTHSRGMAFRIFGRVAVSSELTTLSRPDRIGRILSGPNGTCRILEEFAKEAQMFLPNRYGTPSLETLCDALLSACNVGFVRDLLEQGVCQILVILLDAFVQRDPIVQSYIEDRDTDDYAMEMGQTATMRLILRILEDEEGKKAMQSTEMAVLLSKFHSHYNRVVSDWTLQLLTRQVLQRLS